MSDSLRRHYPAIDDELPAFWSTAGRGVCPHLLLASLHVLEAEIQFWIDGLHLAGILRFWICLIFDEHRHPIDLECDRPKECFGRESGTSLRCGRAFWTCDVWARILS